MRCKLQRLEPKWLRISRGDLSGVPFHPKSGKCKRGAGPPYLQAFSATDAYKRDWKSANIDQQVRCFAPHLLVQLWALPGHRHLLKADFDECPVPPVSLGCRCPKFRSVGW